MLAWQRALQSPVTLELDLEGTQDLHMHYWEQETIFLAGYTVVVT